MGIEGGSNSEVQNQEINQANNEQNEINQAEHQRSGEELEGNSTIDNEGERKQIEGKDDATESAEDESSQLDKEDNIEDDPNTEQPPESDNVAPEQQLDNQDTIESEPSGADEMGEDNNETVDSLDNDDEIEDSEDLDDNQDSTEGDIQDSLDTEDSIDSDDTDDSVEEDDNNEQDSLDSEDSIEDDGEESENPEDGEESELPEGEEKTKNPEDNEETESPEDNEKTENPEGEDTDNPEGEEESERPEGKEDTENPDGATTDNPEANIDMNTLYSIADGGSGSDGAGLNAPDGSDGPDNPENIKGYKDIGEFNDELNKLYSDSQLSNQEKVEAAKGCVDKLNNSGLSPQEKKQSVDAPSDARALKNPENSDWTERTDDNPWPPLNIDFPDKMGLDYDKEITPLGRGEDATGLPETAYRYGGEGGYNYTCEAADGHVPSLDERALPKEYVPEKDREVHFDNDRYCNTIDAIRDYESDPAASLESLNNMIDDINAERGTYIDHLDVDELEALSDKYKQLQDTEFADVRDELGIDDKDFTAYGMHGHAKPMEDTNGDTICEGGADQFNTALPEYMLKRIGVEY